MALKPRLYVELHVHAEDGVGLVRHESANRLSEVLMELLADGDLGNFTGEEYRGNEAVFFFESTQLVSVLPKVREVVDRLGLLRQSSVVIRKDALAGESDLSAHLHDLSLWRERLEQFLKGRGKTRGRRPEVYDYYAVPLPDGRFGHLQYIHQDTMYGDLVQVLAVITAARPCSLAELIDGKLLFPPVQTSVSVGIRTGGWIFLGNHPQETEFLFPTFRGTNSLLLRRHEPGIYEDWWLWSGGENWQPVGKLTNEQRKLEYNVSWAPENLARRIATGENEYEHFL